MESRRIHVVLLLLLVLLLGVVSGSRTVGLWAVKMKSGGTGSVEQRGVAARRKFDNWMDQSGLGFKVVDSLDQFGVLLVDAATIVTTTTPAAAAAAAAAATGDDGIEDGIEDDSMEDSQLGITTSPSSSTSSSSSTTAATTSSSEDNGDSDHGNYPISLAGSYERDRFL